MTFREMESVLQLSYLLKKKTLDFVGSHSLFPFSLVAGTHNPPWTVVGQALGSWGLSSSPALQHDVFLFPNKDKFVQAFSISLVSFSLWKLVCFFKYYLNVQIG